MDFCFTFGFIFIMRENIKAIAPIVVKKAIAILVASTIGSTLTHRVRS